MKKYLVVCKYKEDLSWLEQVPEDWIIYVDDRGTDETLNTPGMESATFFKFVVEYYDRLADEDECLFCQGDPFPHDTNFWEHIKDDKCKFFGAIWNCSPGDSPEFEKVRSWCEVFKLPILNNYPFVQGAQYRVSGEQIHSRTLDFWKALFAAVTLRHPNIPAKWHGSTLERILLIIWNFDYNL